MNNIRRPGYIPTSSQRAKPQSGITAQNIKTNLNSKTITTKSITPPNKNHATGGSRTPATGCDKANVMYDTTINTDNNGISDGEKSDNIAHINETVMKSPTQSEIPTIISNKTLNYANATAKESNPHRDQAILFNSIEGIPQIEDIKAIGQIVTPKNILFVSRISNNRFCIFLSSKDILETLLGKSETISINEHTIPMRRLINPAKKITLSNVCPSIPNQTILNELKKIDIIPVSQINHIKAGINIEGFEHIRSFRRQMFIKQEDINKLPGSLVINNNQTLFRIFFTDDKIICFLCKGVGHTTASCKKHTSPDNPQYIQPHKPPQTLPNQDITSDELPTSFLEEVQSPDSPTFDETNLQNHTHQNEEKQDETITADYENIPNCNIITQTPIENPTNNHIKRPLSDTNSPMSPSSPTAPSGNFPIAQPDKKKPRVTSRSNSLIMTQTEASKIDIALQPAEEFFTSKPETPITFIQFKYILENFTNKSININSLCEEANIDNIVLMDLIQEVKEEIKDRTTKTRLTKLSNLLFQAAPSPPPSSQN